MKSTSYIITILFSLASTLAFGQKDEPTKRGLQGSHAIKLNLFNINPYEIGTGLSYQYYSSADVGLQINADVLFPTPIDWQDEEYGLDGLGIRINPELRFYPRRRSGERFNSFFIGAGPMYKHMKLTEQRWQTVWDYDVGYQTLTDSKYTNNALGLMGRVGIEMLFGESKQWIVESSYGFGLTRNFVKYESDIPRRNQWFFSDDLLSASNRYSGFTPYIDLRVVVGFNFGAKK